APVSAPAPLPAPARPTDDAKRITYARVSDEEQGKTGYVSIPDQLKRCRELAARQQVAVDFEWIDDGRPRGDPSRLEDLVRWCRAHRGSPPKHPKTVCALRRDRTAGTTANRKYATHPNEPRRA